MQISNIILHVVALLSLIVRMKFLFAALKKRDRGKIVFETLIIILIISIWTLLYWLLPRLFN